MASDYLQRSPYLSLAYLLPSLLSLISWITGGVPWLTDLAFAIMVAITAYYLFLEFYQFPLRFGIGGLILFGGVLLWYGYDYFDHWWGHEWSNPETYVNGQVLAKAAFLHCLFIMMMVAGLRIKVPAFLTRIIHGVPEPHSQSFYLWMILVMFFVGLLPYIFFTREPFLVAIISDMFAGRSGTGAHWTTGRTGNVNYNWGAYIALLIQIGQIGGQLAIFYAILVTRRLPWQLVGLAIWAFWLAMAFGTGTRGQVVFMAIPALALIYLKNQASAAKMLKRFSLRTYVITGAAAFGILVLVQIQSYSRSVGFSSEQADFSNVKVLKLQGATMFTEGLLGYLLIPEETGFFYNNFPGEQAIRPIPQTLYWFFVGPIPRALWRTKPIDPVWSWYNSVFTGGRHDIGGTTISQGLVGYWYFRYGIYGVIQGGLFIGWLMHLAEKALQGCEGKPMRILMSLAFATWLFRIFRGVNFNSLYPIMIGGVVLYLLINVMNAVTTPPSAARPN